MTKLDDAVNRFERMEKLSFLYDKLATEPLDLPPEDIPLYIQRTTAIEARYAKKREKAGL